MADFTLDEDQKVIQETMKKFAENELKPVARECDEADKLPLDLLQKVWSLGFCPNIIPEKYGGYGMGRSSLNAAIMAEELLPEFCREMFYPATAAPPPAQY